MIYLFYKVNKDDIFMIKFLLEAYENMAQISTADESLPKIQITVAPDFLNDVLNIIEDLKSQFYMERIFDDETRSQCNY